MTDRLCVYLVCMYRSTTAKCLSCSDVSTLHLDRVGVGANPIMLTIHHTDYVYQYCLLKSSIGSWSDSSTAPSFYSVLDERIGRLYSLIDFCREFGLVN